ncbi:MAG: rhomboid family intramembrane serine protease [Lachnospiraceae bacterium]|nr:rhomboid family intramembrane serine protease [Lachnospiraceae bacterium]MCD8120497.1 rhomboid family intramembrane serine protease [Lachnospiraceae bacterium]
MSRKQFFEKSKSLVIHNGAAIMLVFIFLVVYIASPDTDDLCSDFGAVSMNYMNGEYYRWFICLFLHHNLRHLLSNSLALLSVDSLLRPFLKNRQTIFLFFGCGVVSEIAYSIVTSEPVYDIGASSGIFALLACLLICYVRFQKQFQLPWYRPEVVVVLVYFVFANSSVSSFLVHVFGFCAGILAGTVMVSAGFITRTDS